MKAKTFYCSKCRQTKPVNGPESCTTGYAKTHTGRRVCFACCADVDRKEMDRTGNSGRLPLYLSKEPDGRYKVSNWPGTLKYPVQYSQKGRHNIAGTRYDVWFTDHAGAYWHGVQYGEWTQIVHCKRLKAA